MSNELHKVDRRNSLGEAVLPIKKADIRAIESQNRKYKLVPEDCKALPKSKFRKAILHIESVLFAISTDGNASVAPLEGKIAVPTLNLWAGHLRAALKELTMGQ